MQEYFNFPENKFFSAIVLERLIPLKFRKSAKLFLNALIAFSAIPFLYALFVRFASRQDIYGYSASLTIPDIFSKNTDIWLGVLYITLSLRLIIVALDEFSNSKTGDISGETSNNLGRTMNFFAAKLYYPLYSNFGSNLRSLLEVLPQDNLGRNFLLRMGISTEDHAGILKGSFAEGASLSELLKQIYLKKEDRGEINFSDLIICLFENYGPFKTYLLERKINPTTVARAASLVEREAILKNQKERWWRKENLGRIRGIGKDFAYGETYFIEKFAYDIAYEAFASKNEIIGRTREIELVEKALTKMSGANVLITGDTGVGKHTLLLGLSRMISQGEIFPDLEHKRVFKLYAESIIASGKDKSGTEATLIKFFNEATRAGNVILAIDNFPEFVKSLSDSGINALEILAPYLGSSALHIIALGDTISSRRVLEPNQALMKFFEKIQLADPSQETALNIIETAALELEKRGGGLTIFSYLAIEAVVETATNNLVEGAVPKRASDLLGETFSEAISRKQSIVSPELVLEIVSRKTKMPLGKITETEKKELLNLEQILRERVVGQEEAVGAVANAVRRARSGIVSRQKPIGTFLFLGPTGVGKTETAKALAFIYFEAEEAMIRLDMSEYQSENSIDRLIGSFEKNEPGLLASKISAAPYSVILLDEFEKSHPKIRNLFLQILDEGFFTDFQGRKINLRNTIIIATSNAGSEMIQQLVKEGADQKTLQEKILEKIQQERIVSPELLNRFDSVIIFRPLGVEVLNKIAEIALKKLKTRLAKENYMLNITGSLIQAVAQGGYNPSMGARPMQRFIQDKIEKIISEKIIKGEIRPGIEFEISEGELAK